MNCRLFNKLTASSPCVLQRQAKVALAADIIDPEGINPQRVSDVLNDLEASAMMGRSKTRNVIAQAKKLMDKKLSIIVDTQTLKTGGRRGPIGKQGKQGYPGYQGIQGAEGDRGPTGPQGDGGPQGHPGPRGFRGTTGKIGIEVGAPHHTATLVLLPCFETAVPVGRAALHLFLRVIRSGQGR